MTKKLRPLDYDKTGEDDMFLRALRWEANGLEDIVSEDVAGNYENIVRSAYRDMERALELPKTDRLDRLTPHFLYPLFWTDRVKWGLLSPLEQRVVSMWFETDPLTRAGIPDAQRKTVMARMKKIGLDLREGGIEMRREFFTKREPTHFRSGMQESVANHVDGIIDGACGEFPDWLRMRFGTPRGLRRNMA